MGTDVRSSPRAGPCRRDRGAAARLRRVPVPLSRRARSSRRSTPTRARPSPPPRSCVTPCDPRSTRPPSQRRPRRPDVLPEIEAADTMQLVGPARRVSWAEARADAAGRTAGRDRIRRALAQVRVDDHHATISRPPGVRLDTGGTGKGTRPTSRRERSPTSRSGPSAAAATCASADRRAAHDVRVAHPLDGGRSACCGRSGAVATSGIGARIWRRADGRIAHHIRPGDGRAGLQRPRRRDRAGAYGCRARDGRQGGAALGRRRRPRLLAERGGVIVGADGCSETIGDVEPRPGRRLRLPATSARRRAMNGPDLLDYGWWLASRSAGIVAYLGVEPVRARRAADGQQPSAPARRQEADARASTSPPRSPAWRRSRPRPAAARRRLAEAGLAGIAIPFTMDYRPQFTGPRHPRRLDDRDPRAELLPAQAHRPAALAPVHRWTIAGWALAVVHVLGAGTDAGQWWLQAIVAVTAVPIAGLFALRVFTPAPAPRRNPQADGSAPTDAQLRSAQRVSAA